MAIACLRSRFVLALVALALGVVSLCLLPACSGSTGAEDAVADALEQGDGTEPGDIADVAVAETQEIVMGAAVGDRIADLAFLTCDGAAASLYEFMGPSAAPEGAEATELLWLTLHAGWCTSCRAQHEPLHDYHDAYAARGLQIVFVLGEGAVPGVGVETGYCEAFTEASDFEFPLLRDELFASTSAWDDGAWPVQMLIDSEGIIRVLQKGWDPSFHPEWFTERLEELLP
jgi:hypothetical protein